MGGGKKNILILNSNEQPGYKPNTAYDTLEQDRYEKLIIVENMGASVHNWVISINDGQEIDTVNTYDAIFKNKLTPYASTGTYTMIDSIYSIKIIETAGWVDCMLRDSVFNISNPKSNVIILYAQPYNLYYGMMNIVNAEWKIKGNKIYYWRDETGEFKKKYYLRKK
ncbi:hypothetical protein LJC67_07530 [Bacteroidales bacterium OttesenSCG-928-A14]|nr:hypothetical protein [Bacteroidales bacterium OttesenSCG-928-A14]